MENLKAKSEKHDPTYFDQSLQAGYLRKVIFQKVVKVAKNKGIKRDLAEEIDLLDTMLTSLVELLEKKGVITQQEWEKHIKERIIIK
jgi:DNA-binding MarR family transcriptional regulator